MVYLNPNKSSFDQKTEPHTYEWDMNMRKYYAQYQELIAQNSYRLQKGLKGLPIFGSMNMPYRNQHRYLLLELYSKKQLLGEIRNEEVERYKKINPWIRRDLSVVFNGNS